MSVQKMALVPLELWEEYEAIASSVKDILDREVQLLEEQFKDALNAVHAENLLLRRQLMDERVAKCMSELLH